MSEFMVGVGDPQAVKRWGASLAKQVGGKAYFSKKFEAVGDNAVIQRLTELESDAGDEIKFDLAMMFRGEPTEGDARREGLEESLRFYQDEIKIDQVRHSADTGGRMTRKRTLHNVRMLVRDRESDYWARFTDQVKFVYLSGARGHNAVGSFILPLTWAGRAGNALHAPDTDHIIYPAISITAASGITAGDVMTRAVIERAGTHASMIQELNPDNVSIQPITIEGEEHYVVLMSPLQAHNLRTGTNAGDWLDIQKAAAAAEGSKNRIFRGSLGMIDDIVLHKHKDVIRFNNYGAGSNVPAARALLLGRQAGTVAYGTPGGLSWNWEEEKADFGNQVNISCGTIMGFKKTRFNGRDFGVLAIDTAAAPVK